MRGRRRSSSALGALLLATWLVAGPAAIGAGGATQLIGYSVAAQANVFQLTYDATLAPFHPEVELEGAYSFASLDQTRPHALSSVFWPGSAGGNLGSLVGILGGPTINQLNDPVRAEAPAASGALQAAISLPTGSQMSATIQPSQPGHQTSAADTSAAGLSLPVLGTLGGSSSQSSVDLDPATGQLVATAHSTAVNVGLVGLVTIGSVESSVKGTSTNGSAPVLTGGTVFNDVKVAGQEAYVDGTGIHLGKVGNPVSATVLDAVNKALSAAGLRIYFTSAQKVTIGGTSYFYPASILLYFEPPDPGHDVVTISLGGAALSMVVTSGDAFSGGGGGTALNSGTGPGTTGGGLNIPANPGQPNLAFPTPGSQGSGPVSPPSGTGPVAPIASTPLQPATLVAASTHGLGVGWIVLLAIAALLGGALLPRVPALLRAAGARQCDDDDPGRS